MVYWFRNLIQNKCGEWSHDYRHIRFQMNGQTMYNRPRSSPDPHHVHPLLRRVSNLDKQHLELIWLGGREKRAQFRDQDNFIFLQ